MTNYFHGIEVQVKEYMGLFLPHLPISTISYFIYQIGTIYY